LTRSWRRCVEVAALQCEGDKRVCRLFVPCAPPRIVAGWRRIVLLRRSPFPPQVHRRGEMSMGNARRHKLFFALLVCATLAWERSAAADGRAWMGVDICNLPTQGPLRPATTAGVYVLLVREGSPASSAGVMQDDIVISIDDSVVASAEDLVCAIAMRAPGNFVRLAIVRSGELRVAVVSLTRWPNDMLPAPPACSAPVG
jgi:hypothetical protein